MGTNSHIASDKNLSDDDMQYLEKVDKYILNSYKLFTENEANYNECFLIKSFNSSAKPGNVQFCTWLDYFFNYLETEVSRANPTWARDLSDLVNEEQFIYENKYQSLLFFKDFEIHTSPQKIYEMNSQEDLDPLFSLEYKDSEKCSYNRMYDKFNDMAAIELDVTANLGGSFLEIDTNNLLPDDPQLEYIETRKMVKKYICCFKEHIYNNKEHPINRIVNLFARCFTKDFNTRYKDIQIQLENQPQNEKETILREFEDRITKELQNFILALEVTTKLFYCSCIDFTCFGQESDELINLLTSLVFKTGDIYIKIFNLYKAAYFTSYKSIETKLSNLSKVSPQMLGIQDKYCLDDDTLNLQRTILEKKQIEKDNLEKKGDKFETNKNKPIEKEKKRKILPKLLEERIEEIIDEEDEELFKCTTMKEITESTEPKAPKDIDTHMSININTQKRQSINDSKNQPYLLEQIANDDTSIIIDNPHARYTVNSFNAKTFNFPKLHTVLRNTILEKDNLINEITGKQKALPYSNAIRLLKNISKYRTPIEKMVLVASISDQITECVNDFWKDMEGYIKHDYLSIEQDELMTIFLYIVIKTQMPDLYVYARMIKNFTTPKIRQTMIGFYYATLEATLAYIEELKHASDAIKIHKELKEARVSLAGITNLRLSILNNN